MRYPMPYALPCLLVLMSSHVEIGAVAQVQHRTPDTTPSAALLRIPSVNVTPAPLSPVRRGTARQASRLALGRAFVAPQANLSQDMASRTDLTLYDLQPQGHIQLPPYILLDLYLLRVERLLAAKDCEVAHETMEDILDLHTTHDLPLPADFSLNYARVVYCAGSPDIAIGIVRNYLVDAERMGVLYREALELLNSMEQGTLVVPELIATAGGGPVQSVRQVWTGDVPRVSVEELAHRVAPILWFTPEEPHVLTGHPTPAALPCDPENASEPVVYYRRIDRFRDAEWLTFEQFHLELEYYFYYLHDYGAGCHSNDLETARMRLRMRLRDASHSRTGPTPTERAVMSGASPRGESPRFVVTLDRIEGDAHGSERYMNKLDLWEPGAEDTVVPPTLLVEEGKHAVAPDRNADGQYTPGYDVNEGTDDAWGVRDVMGSGYFWGNSYGAHMTKRRHERNRIGVNLDRYGVDVWASSYRSAWTHAPTQTYELREIPEECRLSGITCQPGPRENCTYRGLSSLLKEKGVRPYTGISKFTNSRFFRRFLSTYRANVLLGDAGVKRSRIGITLTGPGKSIPMGWLNVKLISSLVRVERIGRGAMTTEGYVHDFFPEGSTTVGFDMEHDAIMYYTPSMSRLATWYVGAGASLSQTKEVGVIGEAGIEIRWHPRFLLALGVQYDGLRKTRPVLELGFGL